MNWSAPLPSAQILSLSLPATTQHFLFTRARSNAVAWVWPSRPLNIVANSCTMCLVIWSVPVIPSLISEPFPVMPVCFWNDATGEKYQKAYFTQMPGYWYHGDYMVVNSKTGGVVMLGRSDGTLNPAGVIFGSAEIYKLSMIDLTLVSGFPQAEDSLVAGQT